MVFLKNNALAKKKLIVEFSSTNLCWIDRNYTRREEYCRFLRGKVVALRKKILKG